MTAKYDRIGEGYNETRKADPYLASRLVEHLNPTVGKKYIDLGCGTGNYTIEVSRYGGHFTGVDPSERMLEIARAKSTRIDWKIGQAEDIALPTNSFDGAMATLTLHHWTNLELGFKELSRVLKPQAPVVLFAATAEQMEGYWVRHYFPKMVADSMKQMPSMHDMTLAMSKAGFVGLTFEPYDVQPDLQDKFLYCGKHNPSIYFDKDIQRGISSFSDIANEQEVNEGLKQLASDIQSGKIKEVMKSYSNRDGDYIFIVARNGP
ncbi:MAG: class I SAM-dependent methyltransferase [Bacteroidia bacterium]|nr:class I SAM-dependent methyltransferase [Bacteroidia bacterium]